MEVSMPMLSSQHADYSDPSLSAVRQHRLPLGESTGNVQTHASTPSGYCSPSGVSVTSNGPGSALTISCSPVNTTTASSIPTPPILPTQSLESQQQQAYYQSQQEQHNLYHGSMAKQLSSQHYAHSQAAQGQHQHQHQQMATRRQTRASIHQNVVNSMNLSAPLGAPSLRSNSYSHPSMGYAGASINNGVVALQQTKGHSVNPIYASPQFQAYRKKQGEKDDKTEQIWPDVLEDAFLDALLLIPQMGRKKYAMRGQLHGRNMLISEYLWVAYCLSLPPGVKPDRKMARGRKQVSSHIQVLKNFFIHHRCYHFFFPSKEKKEELSNARRDAMEKESFKDNAVLRALFEGRLPAERPNYEYFGQLLASDGLVALRPSLCWILVSSAAVQFETEGPRRGEAFKSSDGMPLDSRSYPHLPLNHKREDWPERGKIIRGTLLQEYTRALSQKEASSVRDISLDWEERFPGPMMHALDGVVRENVRDILHFHVTLDVQEPDRFPEGSELNSLVEVTIEQPNLQNHRWKSVTRLARPWELMPSGTVPDEGNDAEDEVPVSVITREIGNQYMHRAGCQVAAGSGTHCECFNNSRLRRQQLAVPFPAPEWATMLSMLTGYRKHGLEPEIGPDGVEVYPSVMRGSKKRASFGSTTTATTVSSRRRSSGESTEDGDDSFVSHSSAGSHGSNGSEGGSPTQVDLVRNIAMLQELWSCAPSSASSLSSSPGADETEPSATWTRRAVIVWTFETVYSINEKKMEVVQAPAGCGWRFLTTIDPTSQYHQQQALVTPGKTSPASSAQASMHQAPHNMYASRNVMSPHPGYQQHLNASMSEHLGGATWDPTMSAMASASAYNAPSGVGGYSGYTGYGNSAYTTAAPAYNLPAPLNLLDTGAYSGSDGHSAGLTTPPPSASLTSPYDHQTQQPVVSSGANNPYGHHAQGFPSQLSFMTASSTVSGNGSPGHDANGLAGQGVQHRTSVIDPFLAGSTGTAGTVGTVGTVGDWDASDVASALHSWPAVAGTDMAATAGRGQKRSRSDSLDGGHGAYPVSSMPKLNNNGFSTWR